jgi:MFS-type transporter involved in bile tolerance (Atg22 family)
VPAWRFLLYLFAGDGRKQWDSITGTLGDLPPLPVKFFFGSEVEAFTFTTYTLAASVGFQALAFLTCGAVADYSTYRHRLFVVSSLTGAIATMLFILVADPSWYLVAAWLAIIANVSYGLSFVLYNSYLTILVDDHPEVKSAGRHRQAVHFEILNYMSTMGFVAG